MPPDDHALSSSSTPAGRSGPASHQEAVISAAKPASWAYAEEFVAEDEVLMRARDRAAELGCTPVGHGVGAALRVLTAALNAKAVVEVGTGTGVSGLWLLRGMPEDVQRWESASATRCCSRPA